MGVFIIKLKHSNFKRKISFLTTCVFLTVLIGLRGTILAAGIQNSVEEISKTTLAASEQGQQAPYVFQGFFKNPDYSKPEIYLQTKIQTDAKSKKFKDMLTKINDSKDLSTLAEIYKQTSSLPFDNKANPKFSDTVDGILERNTSSGCTDYGLVFAALSRAKGIPAVFIQTGRIDWIQEAVKGTDKLMIGHILVEVFVQNTWYLVDSTAGKLYLNYDRNNFNLDDGYVVFAKSLEVSDMGIKSEVDNTRIMHAQFKNFDVKTYKQPYYYYLNLSKLTKSKEFKPDNSINISQPPSRNEEKISVKLLVIGTKNESDSAYSYFINLENEKAGMSATLVDDKIEDYSAENILYFRGTSENPPKALSVVPAQLQEGVYKYKNGNTQIIVICSDNVDKRQQLLISIDREL